MILGVDAETCGAGSWNALAELAAHFHYVPPAPPVHSVSADQRVSMGILAESFDFDDATDLINSPPVTRLGARIAHKLDDLRDL